MTRCSVCHTTWNSDKSHDAFGLVYALFWYLVNDNTHCFVAVHFVSHYKWVLKTHI